MKMKIETRGTLPKRSRRHWIFTIFPSISLCYIKHDSFNIDMRWLFWSLEILLFFKEQE
jgi:hypothetical protein